MLGLLGARGEGGYPMEVKTWFADNVIDEQRCLTVRNMKAPADLYDPRGMTVTREQYYAYASGATLAQSATGSDTPNCATPALSDSPSSSAGSSND